MEIETVLDVETITTLDFELDLACEGFDHPTGEVGHIPGTPGAYVIITPCSHDSIIQCEGRVNALLSTGTNALWCHSCDNFHGIEEFRIIPIKKTDN